ncbi:uncharacterized protein [Montipora foliosa]|uniref:uncharacterized protein n=1 Tax=Montipora foliosa TaxID=591990 RepID=UPI0035F133C4
MINDINVNGVNLWKYVDDTSMAETVHKGQPSGIQVAVDELVRQAETDKFQLNETKCKELQISFSRSADSFEAVTINNKPIEVVTSVKLLGLTISNNLKWNAHIENVIKKGASGLYQLRQLKRAKGDPAQLVCFYTTCIRFVTEYTIPAFYNALPLYLKNKHLRIEKGSIFIITAGDCAVAQDLGIRPLLEHYEFLCQKLFKGILDNPSHKLKALLPPTHKPSYNFKNKRHFNMPRLRTSRTMNTFIFAMARKFNG